MTDLVLTPEEVAAVTGYRRSDKQLRELHARGFYRARLGRVSRQVIVERAHYDAVCSGGPQQPGAEHRPKVRPPRNMRIVTT